MVLHRSVFKYGYYLSSAKNDINKRNCLGNLLKQQGFQRDLLLFTGGEICQQKRAAHQIKMSKGNRHVFKYILFHAAVF